VTDAFRTRLKRKGDSYWVNIPKEIVDSLYLEVGEWISVSILAHRSPDTLGKSFGSLKDDSIKYSIIKKTRK